MVYATYDYYLTDYHGTAIPEDVFPRVIKKRVSILIISHLAE